ncbi:MAG: asparagine synthase-related protein [Candidatus Binatia bacterium]
MSGIVGIINLDGTPVDRQLLEQMLDIVAYRGPDAGDIWIDGHVGFGHVLLRTTRESLRERQPCSLDGQVWITADARVDGQAELVHKLESNARFDFKAATDVELILYAYHVWGEDCVKHLLGDFAFAIWDGQGQSLFCARDHFGVKPLYYARTASSLVFASDVDTLRQHPGVSSALNELAVGDFLLFGGNQDESTTIYRDIQRLMPAHRLIVTGCTVRLDRYWSLPTDGHIRYADDGDYVAHFGQLFRTAVKDRLRTDHVACMMSGGMDSAAVAAIAREYLERNLTDVRAYTIVHEHLLPDDHEKYYAGLVAEALGIPIDYLAADSYRLFERWDEPEMRSQQPVEASTLALWVDFFRLLAIHNSVVLTGLGGDPAMAGSCSYSVDLLRRGHIGRFLVEAARHLRRFRSLKGFGLRSGLQWLPGQGDWQPEYPNWIRPGFAVRIGLRERWEHCLPMLYNRQVTPAEWSHQDTYHLFSLPQWSELFELCYASVLPIETRHPFFDVRLIAFLLAIPPLPWCYRKTIHREAMRGILPEPIRTRPKAPLAGDPIHARLSHPTRPDTLDTKLGIVGENYVDRGIYQQAVEQYKANGVVRYAMITAPVNLEYWLQSRSGRVACRSVFSTLSRQATVIEGDSL